MRLEHSVFVLEPNVNKLQTWAKLTKLKMLIKTAVTSAKTADLLPHLYCSKHQLLNGKHIPSMKTAHLTCCPSIPHQVVDLFPSEFLVSFSVSAVMPSHFSATTFLWQAYFSWHRLCFIFSAQFHLLMETRTPTGSQRTKEQSRL